MLTPTGVTVADYNTAVLGSNHSYARMTFANGTVLEGQDIDSSGLILRDILNGDANLTFGKAVMKELNVNIINSVRVNSVCWTEEFTLELGVEINNAINWVTVGYFKGSRPDKTHYVEIINFTAYDRMQLFDTPASRFLNSLAYPLTFSQILSALCSYCGVTYEAGNELNAIKSRSFDTGFINAEGITCRDLLAIMAEACGCYAKITAGGKLKMVWFDTASYSVTADSEFHIDAYDIGEGMTWAELGQYTWAEAEAQFTWADVGGWHDLFCVHALNAKMTEDDVGVHYGGLTGNAYYIVDNPFLVITNDTDADTYVKPIWERLRDFGGYLPINVECIGNWLVESGDIITVDVRGTSVAMPIFTKTMIWDGGCTDTYEATGDLERPEMSSEIRQKLSEGGKFHEYRVDIDGLSSRVGDAEGNITELSVTASGLTTRVSDAEGNITTLQQTTNRIDATVEQKSRVFYGSTTPTGTVADPVEAGDYWIDTANNNATKRYDGAAWVDASYDDPDIATISLSVSKKARVYYANTAPTGSVSDPLVTGDLWIDTANSNQLKRYNGVTWEDASFDDPDKYTVRSGIDIKAAGVEVTGGKYVKIISGGTFDVDSTNFKISSSGKYMEAGNWIFNDTGMSGLDSTNHYLFEVGNSGRTENTIIHIGKSTAENIGFYTYTTGLEIALSDTVNNTNARLAFDMARTVNNYYVSALFADNTGIYTSLGKSTKPWTESYVSSGRFRAVYVGGNEIGSGIDGNVRINDENNNLKILLSADPSSGSTFETPVTINSTLKPAYLASASSKEVKHDIELMPSMGERLDKLKPVTFVYNKDKENRKRFGLIHEDTINVMPEICMGDEKADADDKAINYLELVPMLLKEIQELRFRVKELENKN